MNIISKEMGAYRTNCYIVTIDNKDIIIDPGVDSFSWIKNHAKNPIAILNTHGHFDHTWDNQKVKDFFNIKIYTPSKDAFMLSTDPFNMGLPSSTPDILVNGDKTFNIQGIEIKFHHFPGHSAGCSCCEINNTLFSGDFLFKSTIGRFDLKYSCEKEMKQSVEKILAWNKDMIVYPGHGKSTSLKNEKNTLIFWKRRFNNINATI